MPLQGGLSIERMCELARVSRASFYRSGKERVPARKKWNPFRDSADCFRTPAPLRVPKDLCRAAPPRDAGEHREAVGWALDRTLTIAALEHAIAQRRPRPGLVHHSDRGLQYASGDYVAIPEKYGWSIDQQAAGRRQRIHGEWRRRQ